MMKWTGYFYPAYSYCLERNGEKIQVVFLPDFDLKIFGTDIINLSLKASEEACKQAVLMEDMGIRVPMPGETPHKKKGFETDGLIQANYHQYRAENLKKKR